MSTRVSTTATTTPAPRLSGHTDCGTSLVTGHDGLVATTGDAPT
jgi:hypothetical protein